MTCAHPKCNHAVKWPRLLCLMHYQALSDVQRAELRKHIREGGARIYLYDLYAEERVEHVYDNQH